VPLSLRDITVPSGMGSRFQIVEDLNILRPRSSASVKRPTGTRGLIMALSHRRPV
jgi:hypothetical protein